MKAITSSISKHLISSNWWIHVTILAIISFLYYMTFTVPYAGLMVYLDEYKWNTYFRFFGMILLLFSPAILYSFIRSQIDRIKFKWIIFIIWVLTFAMYPLTFLSIDAPMSLASVNIMPEVLSMIGIVLLIIEIITNPTPIIKIDANLSSWKNKVSPEWIVVSIFLMINLYSIPNLIIDCNESTICNSSVLSIIVQSTLITSIYYLFYLVNHYFLVNKIYRAKGVVYYSFSFLSLVCIFLLPLLFLFHFLPAFSTVLKYHLGNDWIGPNAPTAFWSIYLQVVLFLMFATIPLTILVQWIGMASKVSALEKEKLDTELSLLKQQINPHFFFNTLNNIYSMSRKKSEDTPEAILQLSDLMRYVIYKGQENTVTLHQEVKYIEDYIELQKLRLHQNFDCHFEINVESIEAQVTPLLFIILVENAFKHGIETASEDSYLHIRLDQNENGITFSCSNSIESKTTNTKPGLGLANLKRRLELSYPNAHDLDIQKSINGYQAILKIDS